MVLAWSSRCFERVPEIIPQSLTLLEPTSNQHSVSRPRRTAASTIGCITSLVLCFKLLEYVTSQIGKSIIRRDPVSLLSFVLLSFFPIYPFPMVSCFFFLV